MDQINGQGRAEIRLAATDRLWDVDRRHFHIVDLGKTFGAQQLFAGVLRSQADRLDLANSHGRGFEHPFRGLRWRRMEQAGSARHRQAGQKAASGLYQRHRKPRIHELHLVAMLWS